MPPPQDVSVPEVIFLSIIQFVIFAGTTDNEAKSIPPASFIALFLDITPP